jgi:sialic acid synthase SpsE
MTHDPVYLANVSSALLGALHAARDMVDAGERGEAVADVVRHARELHEIMTEEMGNASRAVGEHAARAFTEMGERLRSLEITIADS